MIQVGEGRTVGSRLLVKAKISGWQGVSGMSIWTSEGDPGVWEFTQQKCKCSCNNNNNNSNTNNNITKRHISGYNNMFRGA